VQPVEDRLQVAASSAGQHDELESITHAGIFAQ
jgi:hypothetical protein